VLGLPHGTVQPRQRRARPPRADFSPLPAVPRKQRPGRTRDPRDALSRVLKQLRLSGLLDTRHPALHKMPRGTTSDVHAEIRARSPVNISQRGSLPRTPASASLT